MAIDFGKNHSFINQIQPGAAHRTQQGSDVRTIKVADQTGSINLCLWNEQSDNIVVKKVFTLKNGFATLHKGRLSLSYAKSGEMSKPLDTVLQYVEQPNMSVYTAENDSRPITNKRSASCDDEKEEIRKPPPSIDTINKHTFIHQLQPGMKNINSVFIVIAVGLPRQTSQGNEVRNIRVADQTASIQMSVWNELSEFVSAGDILRLRNGYVVIHKGCMMLSIGKGGDVLKTSEFFLLFSETPDMSAYNPELETFSLTTTSQQKSFKDESNLVI